MAKKETKTLSIRLGKEDFNAIQKMAISQGITMSEYAREQLLDSMMVDKNKEDIDFIRKQIREELKSILDGYSNRIIKLLIKIGTMTVTMCYFSSKVLYVLVSYHKDKINYEDMLEEAKRKAGSFLGIKDQSIDEITKKILDD